MRGAPAPVQQPGAAEGLGPGTHAGDSAPGGVVGAQPLQHGPAQLGAAAQCGRPPPRHHHQVVGAQLRPLGLGGQRQALGAAHLFLVGDVAQPVGLSEVPRHAEDLGRSGEVEQVDAGYEDEDDMAHASDAPSSASRSATVEIRANRSRRTASVRSMIASALRSPIGLVVVASVTKTIRYPRSLPTRVVVSTHCSVRMPQTVSSRTCGLGEQLLQMGGGEGVVGGLVQDRLTGLRLLQFVQQADVPLGRVEDAAAAGLRVEDPDDQIAVGAGESHQTVDRFRDLRVGDLFPQRAGSEGFLDIDHDQGSVHALHSDLAGYRIRRPDPGPHRNDPVSGVRTWCEASVRGIGTWDRGR